MESGGMSIDELAAAAGLTRRAVRFYVQQKLLPPPNGLGRGSRYERLHLEQLQRIADLQTAGHSLDAIRRILAGQTPLPPSAGNGRPKRRAVLSAELWTRVPLADGVEIQFDANKHQPEVEGLLALKQLAERVFNREGSEDDAASAPVPSSGTPGEG
jgi:DNA-binding transcriptional MerR regulator